MYERVPEQAKGAIESAMQHGEQGATEALDALGGEGRPDVEQIRMEVQERIQEAQQQRGMPEGMIPDAGTRGAPEGVGQPQGVGNEGNGGPPANIPGGRP